MALTELRTKLKVPKKTIDEWVVASAVAGGTDVLVTGNAAILELGKRVPLANPGPG